MKTLSIPEWQQPIIAVPLTQAFPEFSQVKEFRSKTCLFNHDRSRLFDVVSSKYQVIEHQAAVSLINCSLKEYFNEDVKSTIRSVNGGARIRAEFKLPLDPIKFGRNDVSEVTLILRNSYDRAWAFSANLGAFRLVCSNGMMIGDSFGSIKAKHVGEAESRETPLLESLSDMIERAPQLRDLWSEWSGTMMTYDDALELLDQQFPAKYLDPILQEDRYPISKWKLYNDLTAFSTHNTSSVNRRMEFDERIAKLFY